MSALPPTRASTASANWSWRAMAANRCVSAEVIAMRTAENCRARVAGGAFHNFGLVSLVAVRYDAHGGRTAQFDEATDPASGLVSHST